MAQSTAEIQCPKTSYPWAQFFAVLTVCIPPFVNGLQFAWTSPFIPVLISADSSIPMSLEEASYFSVIPPIAAIICSPLAAKLSDTIGRKPVLLFIAVPQFIGWFIVLFAKSLLELYLARIFCGIADGIAFTTVPMYIGEILEPQIRGSLGSFLSFAIYFGQFVMNMIGAYFSLRTTALICITFPVIFLVSFTFMPESPYFLLMKCKIEKARVSLRKLRSSDDVNEEFEKLTTDVQRQISEPSSIKDLFTIDSNRRAMFVATGLRIAHQMSGITAFSVYTQYIFEKAGGNVTRGISAITFTGLQSVTVCLVPIFVDKFGRRTLILFSCVGCAIVLTIETIYFYFGEYTLVDISVVNWVPITGMMLYIIAFCIGFGIVPTLVLSELFSASIKGKAVSCMSILYAFCVLVTSKLFQLMIYNLGLFAPFCLYAICCFVSTFFCYYYVPETKGKTLEEIQQCLKSWKRH